VWCGRGFSSPCSNARRSKIGDLVCARSAWRLKFLLDVGLDYLSLESPGDEPLSGGEARAFVLATRSAPASRVLYVCSMTKHGLHQRDNETRLLATLFQTSATWANTLIVVEHDGNDRCAADALVRHRGAGPAYMRPTNRG